MKFLLQQCKIVSLLVLFGTALYTFAQSSNNAFTVGLTVDSQDVAEVVWATPDFRSGPIGTNDDSNYVLYFHTPQEGGSNDLFEDALHVTEMLSTDVDGSGPWIPVGDGTDIPFGTYDIFIKTDQHLTEKLDNYVVRPGYNQLNFTHGPETTHRENAQYLQRGVRRLVSGDVSNSATDPANLGDNVINSIDLSILFDSLDTIDVDGNSVRTNVNQDEAVNSVDLSIYLENLDKEGVRP